MVNQSQGVRPKNMGEVLKRIQVLQDQAKREKDIIRLNCVTDKVVQVRVNISIAEQSMAALQEAVTRADEGERTHEFTRLTIVNQKVLVLGAEAENCIGEDLSFVGATRVDVEDRPEHSPVRPHPAAGPRHRHRTPGRGQPSDRLTSSAPTTDRSRPTTQVCATTCLHEPTPRTVDRSPRRRSLRRARSPVAQQGQGEVTIGYQGLPYKASGESQTGIQVSDGVLMHVGAGAEAGYDTQRLLRKSGDRARLGASSARRCSRTSPMRPAPAPPEQVLLQHARGPDVPALPVGRPGRPAVQQRLDAHAGLALSTGPAQFGFGIADTFVRIEDPPYNAGRSAPITRYNNQASVEGRWAPGGGRLTGTLRYTNMIDIFQGDLQLRDAR